jgi:hypothetical protein
LGGDLTGSTANFVTANSPVSLRQTLPSGTLLNGQMQLPNLGEKHSQTTFSYTLF